MELIENLISVIMPVYNVDKYLEKAIDSVLEQTYSKFELIIVIDGATDKSYEIANSYKKIDSRVKVYYKENGGLSDARNYGLKKAIGDYIYFIDSDDFIEKDLLEENLNEIKKENSDAVVFGFYVDFIKNKKLEKTIEVKPISKKFNKRELKNLEIDEDFLNYIGYAWNKFYKAQFIKENKIIFEVGLSLIEDIDFNSRLLKKVENIVFNSKSYYHYIQRERISLVNKKYDNFTYLKFKAVKLRTELLKEWKINEQKEFENIESKLYLSAANSTIKNVIKFKSKELNSELNYIINQCSNKKSICDDIKLSIVGILLKIKSKILIKTFYKIIISKEIGN